MMWYLVCLGIGLFIGGLFTLAASLLAIASMDADHETQSNMRLDRLP